MWKCNKIYGAWRFKVLKEKIYKFVLDYILSLYLIIKNYCIISFVKRLLEDDHKSGRNMQEAYCLYDKM